MARVMLINNAPLKILFRLISRSLHDRYLLEQGPGQKREKRTTAVCEIRRASVSEGGWLQGSIFNSWIVLVLVTGMYDIAYISFHPGIISSA